VAQNHRRHERYSATLTVQVTGGGTQRFGTIYEVSLGGAFLEVSPLPPVGTLIQIIITRGDGSRSHLAADVRYYASGLTGPRGLEGVGIAWHELGPEEIALVEDLVARAQSGRPLRDESKP
jgi:hypothetical protein